jgi:hypothetical protein
METRRKKAKGPVKDQQEISVPEEIKTIEGYDVSYGVNRDTASTLGTIYRVTPKKGKDNRPFPFCTE